MSKNNSTKDSKQLEWSFSNIAAKIAIAEDLTREAKKNAALAEDTLLNVQKALSELYKEVEAIRAENTK